jgi:hypothetical protein
MQKVSTKGKWVLVGGVTGITGTLLTIISDFILLGRPVSTLSFFKLGTESMAGLAAWRITIGTFMGIIVLPLQIAGLTAVYFGMRPGGKRISFVVSAIYAHALIMGVAFHTSYAFIASGWKLYYEVGFKDLLAAEMMERFDYFWNIIIAIMLIELLFSSICFFVMVLKRKTLFPRWMGILNPLCIFVLMFPLIIWLPSPIGGYIGPAYLNLCTMLFLTLSTVIIYKRL